MQEILSFLGVAFGAISGGFSLLIMICKPFRIWILNRKETHKKSEDEKEAGRETDRCVLRHMIADIYYRNRDAQKIEQYEYEDMEHLRTQYKALGGNSFVDKIWNEVQSWRIER